MAMNMDQMQTMMTKMHAQNHTNDMKMAQHFRAVSDVYMTMAQNEYEMYQHHAGQAQMTSPRDQQMTQEWY